MIIDDDKGKPNVVNNHRLYEREILPQAGLRIPNIVKRNHVWMIPGITELDNKVVIVNAQGQVVFRANNYKNNLPVGNVSAGIYFYRIHVIEKEKKVKYYTGRLLITE